LIQFLLSLYYFETKNLIAKVINVSTAPLKPTKLIYFANELSFSYNGVYSSLLYKLFKISPYLAFSPTAVTRHIQLPYLTKQLPIMKQFSTSALLFISSLSPVIALSSAAISPLSITPSALI